MEPEPYGYVCADGLDNVRTVSGSTGRADIRPSAPKNKNKKTVESFRICEKQRQVAADVACRQAGYAHGRLYTAPYAGAGAFALLSASCTGLEDHLDACTCS